jgi:hypothetical protein
VKQLDFHGLVDVARASGAILLQNDEVERIFGKPSRVAQEQGAGS